MRVVKISECAIILISIIVAIFSYNHLENSYIKNRQKEISHYEYDELNRKLDDNPSIVIPLEVFKDEKINREELDNIDIMILESKNDKKASKPDRSGK